LFASTSAPWVRPIDDVADPVSPVPGWGRATRR